MYSPFDYWRRVSWGILKVQAIGPRSRRESTQTVSTAPIEPARVIEVLAETIGDQARALSGSVASSTDEEFIARVTQFAKNVEDDTRWVDDTLDRSDVDAIDGLSVAVEYPDGWQIHTARRLRNDGPQLTDETERQFDELIDTIRLFSTAQERFKTVYLQRELTKFSQLTIYSGIPAVLSSILIALLYGDIGGATISIHYLPYVPSLLATVVLIPLVLLAVFILRTATVTRRTAAVGPMLFQKAPEEESAAITSESAE